MMLQQGGMMAEDGRAKTMDASADGYVRAEACQSMVLSPFNPFAAAPVHPLTAAPIGPPVAHPPPLFRSTSFPRGLPTKHGSPSRGGSPQSGAHTPRRRGGRSQPQVGGSETSRAPLALIAGTAVNTNGRASALTAPHGPSQQSLMIAALQRAGNAPGSILGLQLHANGTPLGDPIEVAAVSAILGQARSCKSPSLNLSKDDFGNCCIVMFATAIHALTRVNKTKRIEKAVSCSFECNIRMHLIRVRRKCLASSQISARALPVSCHFQIQGYEERTTKTIFPFSKDDSNPVEIEKKLSTCFQITLLVLQAPASAPLALATIKGFTGHQEAASGVANLLAAAITAGSQSMPPAVHLRTLNPLVAGALAGQPTRIASGGPAGLPAPTAGSTGSMQMGVNAFGAQGTNAHAVIAAGAASGTIISTSKAVVDRALRKKRCWVAPPMQV